MAKPKAASEVYDAGDRMIAALEEAVAHKGGAETGAVVHRPVDVGAIRRRLGVSQERFAEIFDLAPTVIRDWEQGRRAPDRAARTLLRIIDREPKAAIRALDAEALALAPPAKRGRPKATGTSPKTMRSEPAGAVGLGPQRALVGRATHKAPPLR